MLATVLLLSSQAPERRADWFVAITAAWAASAAILLAGSRLAELLGMRGLRAIERLMGMVLVASAVQMCLDGVEAVLAR